MRCTTSAVLACGFLLAAGWSAFAEESDTDFTKYGIYAKTAPRAADAQPVVTKLPLQFQQGDRIALIGNTLWERAQFFGQFETLLHQRFPNHQLVVRNLAWSADEIDLQPRPANFADMEQHLTHEKVDVIFAAFGFNESFAGEEHVEAFKKKLSEFVQQLKTKAFNGESGPRLVLVSPSANENIDAVAAADRNNARIRVYAEAIRQIAQAQQVAYANVYDATFKAAASPGNDLTINGVHLTEEGYTVFAKALYEEVFAEDPPEIDERIRQTVIDKNRQYFRRYRPANTFYYTGNRSKSYGYLDFLPAMRNFDMLTANRDQRIWKLAQGKAVPEQIVDDNLPELPKPQESRGANRWMSAEEELRAFKIDPRFEVNLFAGEEEFPDIAAPIQMRWDSQGRLWVSCSTTYPHVYPGNEPNDKIVVLEDLNGDGKADKSSVFAENLHIPLSFEFGDGGLYVSEMPHLTFLKDTDGDGKADLRKRLLTGFGTEDSHHALHDFAWTPDGDLIFRESIFHHSQVETPYGPVRQQNSGWFRFEPRSHRLTSFGTYHGTNPWGVTFDDWGRHVASHPVFAAAFHALDPPYPQQHPRPSGLRAYSGTCGQEFVDFGTFPPEMQGGFVKVRYKPTNRVEFHKWTNTGFGFDEEYVGDILFSSNLSFIPVDIRFGPRGAMYVCDWYNPIKGHAQYSLRDERRDRHSGRIWRITAKGHPLQEPPKIHGATIKQLLDLLKRREYRYRYWAKRELRERSADEVKTSLDNWVKNLKRSDPRYRHHQLEALWLYRWIDTTNFDLLRELIACENHNARAAAVQQLRYWHSALPDSIKLLRSAASDADPLVRMEAAIAASYIGSQEASDAIMVIPKFPMKGHLAYALRTSLGSHTLRRHWEGNPRYPIESLLKQAASESALKEPTPSASQAQFDAQENLKLVKMSCQPERMLYTIKQFEVTSGQPIKIVFTNPDATDHNLVFVKPGKLAEVGIAANEMAKDPKNAQSDFIPSSKQHLILQASPMIGPTRKSSVHVLRFHAPTEPGIYPYVCTFPGHWVVMNGIMVVADDLADVEAMLAAHKPAEVKQWKLDDFAELAIKDDEKSIAKGMQAFVKARCNQCHVIAGHGVNLGPDLKESIKKYQGRKLLQQVLHPSSEINKKYQTYQLLLDDGRVVTGVITKETPKSYHVVANLLTPDLVKIVPKTEVEEKIASRISPMPEGLVNVLTKEEILDLLAFLQQGDYELPKHLQHHHQHK